MTKQIIYVTNYNKPIHKLKQEVIHEYSEKCIICGCKEEIIITTILPEEIYTELNNETWNNIPLCKYCNQKLRDYNKKDKNGIKNLLQLVKE